jgi:hypothetical protein
MSMPVTYGKLTSNDTPYGDGCSEFHTYGKWFTEHGLAFAITYENKEWMCLAFPEADKSKPADSSWAVSSGAQKNPLTALQVAYILAKGKIE